MSKWTFLVLAIISGLSHEICSASLMTMSLVTHPAYWTVPLGASLKTASVLRCVRLCQRVYRTCKSFIYNSVSQLCTPGSRVSSEVGYPGTSVGNLLFQTLNCDTTVGQSVYRHAGVAVCLYVSTDSEDYNTARKICAEKGMRLYTGKNPAQLDLLRYVATTFVKGVLWVGLTDQLEENTFVWDDGTPLNMTWAPYIWRDYPRQPDNGGVTKDEHCAEFGRFDDWERFNDYKCYKLHPFVCEPVD